MRGKTKKTRYETQAYSEIRLKATGRETFLTYYFKNANKEHLPTQKKWPENPINKSPDIRTYFKIKTELEERATWM